MFRAAIIAVLLGVGTMLPTAVSASTSETWCAVYDFAGSNCGFHSFEQCRAAVSGIGGSCVQRDSSPSDRRYHF